MMGAIMACIAFVSAVAWWEDASPAEAASYMNEVGAVAAVLVGIGCLYASFKQGPF